MADLPNINDSNSEPSVNETKSVKETTPQTPTESSEATKPSSVIPEVDYKKMISDVLEEMSTKQNAKQKPEPEKELTKESSKSLDEEVLAQILKQRDQQLQDLMNESNKKIEDLQSQLAPAQSYASSNNPNVGDTRTKQEIADDNWAKMTPTQRANWMMSQGRIKLEYAVHPYGKPNK